MMQLVGSERLSIIPFTKETFPSSRHSSVGVAWFSDTILFYTREDTDEAIRILLEIIGWLLFETILWGWTRIRGGIAYGEIHIDRNNSLFVGVPIIEAYRLERAQEWSGVALTDSAIQRLPTEARSGVHADWWLTPWDVPLKDGAVRQTLAINWNLGIHHPGWRFLWSKYFSLPAESDWLRDKSLCEKFLNTKRFHEAHCLECRENPVPHEDSTPH